MLVALLDANVLWSAPVRDTLLRAAERYLFRPTWSRRILEEVAASLLERRPDLGRRRVDRLIAQLNILFPEAVIEGYDHLIPVMRNEEKDRHVLAAAVFAHADFLVTWNIQDFPAEASEPYPLAVQTPDDFLCELWATGPGEMAEVLRQQASDLTIPALTIEDLIRTLKPLVPAFANVAAASGLL